MTDPQPLLQVQHVAHAYRHRGRTLQVLDELSMTVQDNDFVCLRGPSGCGKSTLLMIMGLLLRPERGEVLWQGKPTRSLSSRQRAAIRGQQLGFVFQAFHLVPYLNVRDNICLGTGSSTHAAATRASELVAQVGLAARATHKPGQLSVGEQQRVALARALVHQPACIFADEPTGNLDDESAANVLELLQAYHRDGGAVVLVTHDRSLKIPGARNFSMLDGRLSESDLPQSPSVAAITEPQTASPER